MAQSELITRPSGQSELVTRPNTPAGGAAFQVSQNIPLHCGAAVVSTNPGASPQELNQNRRGGADLTGFTEGMVYVAGSVNGAAGALCAIHYSLNGGGSFAALGPTVACDAMTGATVFGTWLPLAALALAEVVLSAFITGDGAADPAFLTIVLVVR